MKILLFGKTGQVGWELQRALAPLGELVALDRSESGGPCGDLEDLDGIAETIRNISADVIVNAAAYTAVDKAESEPDRAHRINAEALGVMAREAKAAGALLVHYSTDYVFDGSGSRPWREDDAPNPLNVYGETKRAGEAAIAASGAQHLIFRTSWVYGLLGGNFAKTMLRIARERDRLTVIDDQLGAPTGADLIADVTAHSMRAARGRPETSGLYHLAPAGETSWHGYAIFLLDKARAAGEALCVAEGAVEAIPSEAMPMPARRPLNSRLDTAKLRQTFDLRLPPWQAGVARMLHELRERPA